MTATHIHTCFTCGRDFEHESRSNVRCGPVVWRCSECFLEALYGIESNDKKAKE